MGNTTINYQKACNELLQRQMKGSVGEKTLNKIAESVSIYGDEQTQKLFQEKLAKANERKILKNLKYRDKLAKQLDGKVRVNIHDSKSNGLAQLAAEYSEFEIKDLNNQVDDLGKQVNKLLAQLRKARFGMGIAGAIGLATGLGLMALIKRNKTEQAKNETPTPVAVADTTNTVEQKPEPVAKVEEKYHIVEKGDNIWNIAKADLDSAATNKDIRSKTDELMNWNGIKYEEDNYTALIYPKDTIFFNQKTKPEPAKQEEVKTEKNNSYFEKYKNTEAGQKTLELDRADGKEDGKISAEVWNKYAKENDGKEIKYGIDNDNAIKSVATYMARVTA